MRRSTISLWADSDFRHAIHQVVGPVASHMSGSVAILPSSLDAKDSFARLVEVTLPEVAQAEVLTPVSGSSAHRAFFTPMVLGNWIDRPIRSADSAVDSVTYPADVAQANHRIIVTDVVEIARTGPFVLDLPARYIHPRQRMRLLASGQREASAAEVASALPADLYVVCLAQREGLVAGSTTDPIAAELLALAMSELSFGAPRGFSGPWEDPVVQRATELQMGVLHPSAIVIVPDGPERNANWSRRIVDHIRLRLGITNQS